MGRREGSHSAVADRYGLTERQHEVLALMAQGRTNYEIAQELGLTLEGAKYHVSEILGKLGVESREEAVAIANRRSWSWPNVRRVRIWAPIVALVGTAAIVAALFVFAGSGESSDGPPHVWVAFIHGRSGPGPGSLEVVDATAGSQRTIGRADVDYGAAIWSPDGSRLFTISVGRGQSSSDIAMSIFNADDGWRETTLASAPLSEPSWSPDSSRFVLLGATTVMYDRDGKLLRKVETPAPPTPGSSSTAVWSPDSSRVMGVENGLLLMADATGAVRQVVPPASFGSGSAVVRRWVAGDIAVVTNLQRPPGDSAQPATFRVKFNGDHETWTPTSAEDALPPAFSTAQPTVFALESASGSAVISFVGLDQGGTALVFRESEIDATTGRRPVALAVRLPAGTIRIPIPSDVLSEQTERGGVVIAPAR